MQAKDCQRCKKPFGCQMAKISQCQCNKVSLSPSLRAWLTKHFENCLCLSCLSQLKEIDEIAQVVPFPEDNKKLVRKYHYYMDKGRFVFTELYHYQKDYCCQNNCRHCVYDYRTSKPSTL